MHFSVSMLFNRLPIVFIKVLKDIKIYCIVLILSGQAFACKPEKKPSVIQEQKEIVVGASSTNEYVPNLMGKRVALVANKSSRIDNVHLVDSLRSLGVNLVTIFAPEHGFRSNADAGEHIQNDVDVKTGIPIISLYGKNKKPSKEMLKGIDIIVYDIQDVGVRFYTYISTLHYIMEACAEAKIPVWVLDRPNPNGDYIDGPILDTAFSSFVGMHPVPVVYGMTVGEYAQMINGQGWLNDGIQCELYVQACKYYGRRMQYELPVRPSPNLPNYQSIRLYPSLCFFEGTKVSVGRGTEFPFQVYGAPFLKGRFQFTPQSGPGAKYPKHENKLCQGEDLRNKRMNTIELKWLINAYKQMPEDFFNSFFVKLAGTDLLRMQIEQGLSINEIKSSWKDSLENFRKMRKPYLIYQ